MHLKAESIWKMAKKPILCILILLMVSGCGRGLSKKQQAKIDATIKEYSEKLIGPTWWNYHSGTALRFYEDGIVEEDGRISEPGNWYISFGEQYNRNLDLSKTSRKFIEEYCDYFLRYDSPAYFDGRKTDDRISFNDNGNLVLWDEEYFRGVDYIHDIPEDAYLDPYFYGNYKVNNWGVWAKISEDNKEGSIWIFQDDGLGADTIGSYGGQLIYPDTFTWAFKDDMLYIEWPRDEEYIAEYGKDVDVFIVEKGDGEFYASDYLDHEGKTRTLYRQTDKLDLSE